MVPNTQHLLEALCSGRYEYSLRNIFFRYTYVLLLQYNSNTMNVDWTLMVYITLPRLN